MDKGVTDLINRYHCCGLYVMSFFREGDLNIWTVWACLKFAAQLHFVTRIHSCYRNYVTLIHLFLWHAYIVLPIVLCDTQTSSCRISVGCFYPEIECKRCDKIFKWIQNNNTLSYVSLYLERIGYNEVNIILINVHRNKLRTPLKESYLKINSLQKMWILTLFFILFFLENKAFSDQTVVSLKHQ